ncbi:PHP domain-containing protein [Candidatus Woesearchaeota archaeon]|nr:PHP domain-containing protein [Candidatus Woesearchaeota archaeon]
MEIKINERKIYVNNKDTDFHIHSNFSDGINTIDEIVQYASSIGLKKIAITDHSEPWARVHEHDRRRIKTPRRTFYDRWENVHNDVKVLKGIEIDLLDSDGGICNFMFDYEFVVLSAHEGVYKGDPRKITEAYLRAIDKHGDKIDAIGHVCANYFAEYLDVKRVVEYANSVNIILEINGTNLNRGITMIEKLKEMVGLAERIHVNSDAHTLNEIRDSRKIGYRFLEDLTLY